MNEKNQRNSILAYLYQIFLYIFDQITIKLLKINSLTISFNFTCIPITAKINIIITRTNVKFPKAPIDLPIIEIRRFNVCQDLANLNTRNLIQIFNKILF